MYDIFFVGQKTTQWFKLKTQFITAKYAKDFEEAQKKALTEMFWVVWDDLIVLNDFDFYFKPKEWDKEYIHVFKNNDVYDGIVLFPKNINVSKKELNYRFFINKKEIDIQASRPKSFDYFEIDSYDEYLEAFENSKTEMFWMSSRNIEVESTVIKDFYINHHDNIDRKQNHAFIHRVDGKDLKNGLFLCSKHHQLTKREVDYRFPVKRKEWNIVGSRPVKYDVFEIDSYDEYLEALKNSKTEMFWGIPNDIEVCQNFDFDMYFTHDNEYDRKINHVFKNGEYYDGLTLFSKNSLVTENELRYRFFSKKKEINKIASMPKSYDVVFISYNELNADENYELLLEKVPFAKRVHGIKGIHQAHIEAAKMASTTMLWIIDGDAKILEDFNFDYQVPRWKTNQVFVWRSKNPINDLVYGYGGVKLFPVKETLSMDINNPDMTTSITNKFNVVNEISNITEFNTDPFNTWKSAFRECVKLSSKIIDRQKNKETEKRLKIWQTVGVDRRFGEYAILGAKAGADYGKKYQNSPKDLSKINDFDWLKDRFNDI